MREDDDEEVLAAFREQRGVPKEKKLNNESTAERHNAARHSRLGRARLLIAVDNGSVPRAPTAAVRGLSAEQRLLLRCADNEPALRLPQAHQ